MSSIDIDDTDLPEYFQAKAMKKTPERTWVGLTEEEIQQVAGTVDWTDEHIAWNFASGIEELLKEKNT